MKHNIIYALRELGIDITDIQHKYPPSADGFGVEYGQPTKFVLKGAYYEDMNVERLIEELFILRSITNNKNPAVKDLYEQLKTTAGLTK